MSRPKDFLIVVAQYVVGKIIIEPANGLYKVIVITAKKDQIEVRVRGETEFTLETARSIAQEIQEAFESEPPIEEVEE